MPTEADYELLGLLIAADNAANEPRSFTLIYTGGGREIIGHPGWPDDAEVPSEVQIDELGEFDWLRVSHSGGNGRQFVVTGAGRQAWGGYVAERSHVPSRVSLEWPAARQLLERIYERYLEQGAPTMGVDLVPTTGEEMPTQDAALIRELSRAGFLEVGWESTAGPRFVRPSTATLQMLAGWPVEAAQDVLNGLVDDLNAEIDRTPDAGRRSILLQVRDGLVGVARDIAIAYIEKKIGAS